MTSLIHLNNIGKTYGLRPVLRNVTFDCERGTVTVLLGANGAGKTTLLRIMAGLVRPTAGTLMIGGWSIPAEVDQVRRQLGVITHQPLLYPALTATENLQFYADLYGVPDASARIAALLDQVGLARRTVQADRDLVRGFSRGMQQRLALARALIHDPAVLLFDEPYTGLDVEGARMLDRLIHEQKAQGKTVLLSLHDLNRAAQLADRYLILQNGRASIQSAETDLTTLETALTS